MDLTPIRRIAVPRENPVRGLRRRHWQRERGQPAPASPMCDSVVGAHTYRDVDGETASIDWLAEFSVGARLLAKREKLIADIAALDAEIERLLGTGGSSRVAPA